MFIYPQAKRNETGFTIMEMLIVISIIGILAAVGIPAFSQWLPNSRLKSAVQDIYSNMQLTKMEAIKKNTPRVINFDPDADTYEHGGNTVTLEDYGSGIRFGEGSATGGIGGETVVDGVTFTDDEVIFNSRGMCDNSGYVYLTNDKGTAYSVGTLASGVIVLRKWNGSDWQ